MEVPPDKFKLFLLQEFLEKVEGSVFAPTYRIGSMKQVTYCRLLGYDKLGWKGKALIAMIKYS